MNPFQTLRHCEIFALRMAAATGRPYHVLKTYGAGRDRCVVDHEALCAIQRRGVIALIELTIHPPEMDCDIQPLTRSDHRRD
jgi:hypothetical protein